MDNPFGPPPDEPAAGTEQNGQMHVVVGEERKPATAPAARLARPAHKRHPPHACSTSPDIMAAPHGNIVRLG